VEGKVTVDGQPLTMGSLLFRPNAEKGNTSKLEPAGSIDSSGNYKLYTNSKPGAPLGWYKVTVAAQTQADSTNPGAATSLVAAKYNAADTTDLSVEVVATPAPGAYDLKLTK